MEDVRNGERLKMRHWLKKVIDSGEYHGVEWTDKEAGKFRVPWKHASRHGWDIDRDASIFKMWAVYTGKFSKETRNLSDKQKRSLAKHWKANFRCALNALHDIEVVHKEGKTKGRDAYKVFRLLPQCRTKSRVTKIRANSTGSLDELDSPMKQQLHRTKSEQIQRSPQMESDELDDSSEEFSFSNDHIYTQVKSEEEQGYFCQTGNVNSYCSDSLNNFQFESFQLPMSSSSSSSDSTTSETSKLIELLSPSICSQSTACDINDKIGAVLTELVNASGGFSFDQELISTEELNRSQYLKKDIAFFSPGLENQEFPLPLSY